jgi:hypothetical protein
MNDNEVQYEEFVKKLENKFPKMFANPYGGIDVDAGWWPIIETLCANIQSHTDWWNTNRKDRPVVEQVVVEQIKEKFGSLRFYYQGGDDYIRGLVTMAEEWADASCEICGKPGIRRTGGWIKTLCNEHEAERQERLKKRFENET